MRGNTTNDCGCSVAIQHRNRTVQRTGVPRKVTVQFQLRCAELRKLWVACLCEIQTNWTKVTVLGREMKHGRMGPAGEREGRSSASTWVEPTKLHKFIFGKETKYLLLQAVRQHNIHRDAHGKCVWRWYHKLTMKIFPEKPYSMLVERGKTKKRIIKISGVKKVNGTVKNF